MLKTKKYYREVDGYQLIITCEVDRKEVKKGWFSKVVTNKINYKFQIKWKDPHSNFTPLIGAETQNYEDANVISEIYG